MELILKILLIVQLYYHMLCIVYIAIFISSFWPRRISFIHGSSKLKSHPRLQLFPYSYVLTVTLLSTYIIHKMHLSTFFMLLSYIGEIL